MKWLRIFWVMLVPISLFTEDNLPAPYLQLKDLLSFEMSWKAGLPWEKFHHFEHAPFLENLMNQMNAKVVIELGSNLGGSAIYISQCLPPEGKLYAVDHWDAPPEFWDAPPYREISLGGDRTTYTQFLSNLIHAKLAFKVFPVRMSTQAAVTYFIENRIVPDLVYVDASHDEQSVYEDIQAYFPLIKGHGIICGDDWNFPDMTVERAVRRFASENHLSIWISPTNRRLWVLQENDAQTN